ncbi:MAG: queuosine precursor transporter [Methanothrix sp.]|nr:queuosine precursor transporter [Methanothrix sp.]
MIDKKLKSLPGNSSLLDIITGTFVAVLLISNIASSKIVQFGPFSFDGGTILFPLAYIFGDVLTEVYGYKKSRRVIWTGFFWIAAAAALFGLVASLPTASDSLELAAAFSMIFGLVPRIVAASMIAYFLGEFSNSFLLAKIKIWTAGKALWVRTISSTLVGEGVDTFVFLMIAFWGVFPPDLLWTIGLSNYIFKVGTEVLFTPITYIIVNWLKKVDQQDVYDIGTNFSPFSSN